MLPYQCKEIVCKTALNKITNSRMPYQWDLNIYRGCSHGCKYCYAVYSHQYIGANDYFREIYVKINIIEQLERQLKSPKWSREIINIGGVTDSYQPLEAQKRLMPEVLKLLIKYQTPAIISTKSDLILRDYDLIDQLSNLTYVNIASTITTTDERMRTLLEPGGAPSQRRFEVLREFRKTNATIGVHVMPIVPFLTDSYENFDTLFCMARKINAHYVLPGTLRLRGLTRAVFFDFIRESFPKLYQPLCELYQKGTARKAYKNQLYQMVHALRYRYGLSSNYAKPIKERLHKEKYEQLSLFPK